MRRIDRYVHEDYFEDFYESLSQPEREELETYMFLTFNANHLANKIKKYREDKGSYQALRDEAFRLGIRNYSRLNKKQLEKEIEKARTHKRN